MPSKELVVRKRARPPVVEDRRTLLEHWDSMTQLALETKSPVMLQAQVMVLERYDEVWCEPVPARELRPRVLDFDVEVIEHHLSDNPLWYQSM